MYPHDFDPMAPGRPPKPDLELEALRKAHLAQNKILNEAGLGGKVLTYERLFIVSEHTHGEKYSVHLSTSVDYNNQFAEPVLVLREAKTDDLVHQEGQPVSGSHNGRDTDGSTQAAE